MRELVSKRLNLGLNFTRVFVFVFVSDFVSTSKKGSKISLFGRFFDFRFAKFFKYLKFQKKLDCVVIVNKAKKLSKLFLRKNHLAKNNCLRFIQ